MSENLEAPSVVHLGKKSKKEIKRYKRGIGTMFMEVQQVIAQANEQTGENEAILPVVVIHRKKRKKGILSRGKGILGF